MKLKSKFLVSLAVAGACVTSCATGIRYEISEYFLDVDYKTDFRILHLSDTHIAAKDYQERQFKFLDLTIRDSNCDMIVVTGDLFTFADKATAIRYFDFLDSYGKPWTVTFGNHDEQCYFSVDWMTNYLNNYGSNCKFIDLQADDVFGNSNFVINLNKNGKTFEHLIIMDSNRYHYGFDYFGYDYFKKDQIEWYKRVLDYSKDKNGEVVKSLMFYHIPLPEINDIDPSTYISGELREDPCPPKYNSGFFDVIKSYGSTTGMYFGHDHVNDFVANYQGIDFAYAITSTDRIYALKDLMGGRVITLHDDHSVSYESVLHSYSEVE